MAGRNINMCTLNSYLLTFDGGWEEANVHLMNSQGKNVLTCTFVASGPKYLIGRLSEPRCEKTG